MPPLSVIHVDEFHNYVYYTRPLPRRSQEAQPGARRTTDATVGVTGPKVTVKPVSPEVLLKCWTICPSINANTPPYSTVGANVDWTDCRCAHQLELRRTEHERFDMTVICK
jgi:hypothetical protein